MKAAADMSPHYCVEGMNVKRKEIALSARKEVI